MEPALINIKFVKKESEQTEEYKERFEVVLKSNDQYNTFNEVRKVGHSKYHIFPGYFASPTHNCQLVTIGSANAINGYGTNYLEYFLRSIYTRTNKRLLLLDVREDEWYDIWESLEPYCTIKTSTQYESTNESEMMIVLLKLEVTRLGFDDPEEDEEYEDDEGYY